MKLVTKAAWSITQRLALVSLALAMLLSSLGTSIANVSLPTLAKIFHATFQDVQWVVLAYLLVITIFIVSVGKLGDIFGRKRLLLIGIFLFTLGSGLCSFAPTLGLLIAARAVQGLGAAIMMALTMAFISETVPKAKTGLAMGLLNTMSAVGTALGPSLGGVLISHFGWRAIYSINLPLGILTFGLAYYYLPIQEPKATRNNFDSLGTLLLAFTLATYALAMTTRLDDGQFGLLNLALLITSMLGLGLFILVQTKVKNPLIQLKMFNDMVFNSSLGMNALVATVMMTTLVVGPFFLLQALELSDVLVGMVMSIGPIISVLSGVPSGRMIDRYGASLMITIGLTIMLIGCAALAVLPMIFGIVGYIVATVILTPGYALFQAANNTIVMLEVNAEDRGIVSGILGLSRNLGLITGACIMGAIFALTTASTNITTASPEAIAHGMQITFAVAAALVFIALIIAIRANHHKPHDLTNMFIPKHNKPKIL
jgi:EmrB/QacA subfamily drug resistance transporter